MSIDRTNYNRTNYRVYQSGEFRGAIEFAEDAAGFVAFLGADSEVRYGGKVVWREGKEKQFAVESYDEAAEVMRTRAGTSK